MRGLVLLVALCVPAAARSEVRLNPLFADDAVLQQGMELPVWGTARNGEPVTVEFAGQSVSTYARDGKWSVRLRPLAASGPVFDAVRWEGSRAVVSFTRAGHGLVARDGLLKGFLIAGHDKKFVPAEAVISGATVVVSSPLVLSPAAVRYGFINAPDGNLFNSEGLPASPFRTDTD